MDSLVEACEMLSLSNDIKDVDWYNNTIYNLYMSVDNNYESRVYSKDYIQNGTYIGEIIGEKKYAWEVIPSPYIVWVDDECAIDCTDKPRCITSLIQESFYEGLTPNCEMIIYTLEYETKVGICACKDILPNEELIFKQTMDYY